MLIYIHVLFQQSFPRTPSEDLDIIHTCCRDRKGLILTEISLRGALINEVEICWRLFWLNRKVMVRNRWAARLRAAFTINC